MRSAPLSVNLAVQDSQSSWMLARKALALWNQDPCNPCCHGYREPEAAARMVLELCAATGESMCLAKQNAGGASASAQPECLNISGRIFSGNEAIHA